MKPSEKQLKFAQSISKRLNLTLTKDILENRKECSAFITKHKEKLYRINMHETKNEDDIEAKETLRYWHDGLTRTAFEGYANLESELNDVVSFSYDKIVYALTNFPCKNLKNISNDDSNEEGVRHLIMTLEPAKAAQTGRTSSRVILILPLKVHFTNNDNATKNQTTPYVWQRAGFELPVFNQRLLGIEGEIEGLDLNETEKLDIFLTDDSSLLPENASLEKCLEYLDNCFDILGGGNKGVRGWIDALLDRQHDYVGLKNKQIQFKLVDGRAVGGATKGIRSCYEELFKTKNLFTKKPFQLLKKFIKNQNPSENDTSKPFSVEKEQESWTSVNCYLGNMDNLTKNNKRSCYALDPSQRLAISLFTRLPEGNLLAVNGPPGTGKTSLLRAVIADTWIKPLLSEEALPACPIIIACAATNQAVTNIISSFDSVPGHSLYDEKGARNDCSASLSSRWLPHLVSYGWYQPASKGNLSSDYHGYQIITRHSSTKNWEFDCAAKQFNAVEKSISNLESLYLKSANEFFNSEETISSALEKLRIEVKTTVTRLDSMTKDFADWDQDITDLIKLNTISNASKAEYGQALLDDTEAELAERLTNSQLIELKLLKLSSLSDSLKREFQPKLSYSIKRYIEWLLFKDNRLEYINTLRGLLANEGFEFPTDHHSYIICYNLILKKIDELKLLHQGEANEIPSLLARNEKNIKARETHEKNKKQSELALSISFSRIDNIINSLENLGHDKISSLKPHIDNIYHFVTIGNESEIKSEYRLLIKQIQDWLDLIIRPNLFHVAARYWEGRYIQYKKYIAHNAIKPNSADKLRELAMLAPIFVTTSYSAPKLMQCSDENREYNYLYGNADLLIVDEAGQGTPEIGACVFSFAKRAIVVGDIKQIKPVWNITEPIDKLIFNKFKLRRCMDDLKIQGAKMSSGSVMLMAQSSTYFYDTLNKTPGVTLTNHYRCRRSIINICNDMVYQGILTVVDAATEPKNEWRSPLGFLVVPGTSTRLHSGSRCNIEEAKMIGRWVKEQAESILSHYGPEKTISDLVAIITPYKGQVKFLRREIANQFNEDINDKEALANKMVIGTVHSLQGSERMIVLFSMVDTANPEDTHFYDEDPSLINVAISRAKEVFIIAVDQKVVDYARKISNDALKKPSDYLFYYTINRGVRLNSRRLLLIESPNKRDCIEKSLSQGLELEIVATNGQLTQLDINLDWDPLTAESPKWLPLSDKESLIYERIALLWPDLEAIYIATDPDAEGECIAWLFLNRIECFLGNKNEVATKPKIKRMRFYNLQYSNIQAAYNNAKNGLNAGLVKSALFRMIIDQLISRHYPAKLGLGAENTLYAGVGRVQLAILDLIESNSKSEEEYFIEVKIPIPELNQYDTFILSYLENNRPIIFTDLRKAKNSKNKLEKMLSQHKNIEFEWNAKLEQLPEFPAINTSNFLALAAKETDLKPWEIMTILQDLYEGNTGISSRVIMENIL